MRVLVTGGTGVVGRPLVERLGGEGVDVRALARSEASAAALRDLGAEPVGGDVLDLDSLAAAMRGCELVYHAAGYNAFCLRDPAPMFEVNVRGSENVVRAAAQTGVPRVVYTSSAASLGERKGTVGSEGSPHRGSFLSEYERSKFEAERAVLAAAAETGADVVCVNPASVQGPGRATGSTKLLLDYLNGRLKAVVDSTLSLVDVEDCTTGHLLAAARGQPGERYVLSGATLTVREGLALLSRISGVEQPLRTVPPWLAMAVATAAEAVAWVKRDTPRICRELARTLTHGHAYDGSKASRELGLRYTPIEETLRRTIAWWEEQGLLPSSPAAEARVTS
ncbi:MAG: NAD-dependent epimerase/dehydratase family protein [Gaiellaceae bacterium]